MRVLLKPILCLILSLLCYVAVFAWLLKKPLTVGYIQSAYAHKFTYARSVKSPKIVLVAGSNGLYSHRCEVIAKETGMPCVNAAVTAGLTLDYTLLRAKDFLNPGDIVLMPLEYEQYRQTRREMLHSALTNQFLVSYDPEGLFRLPSERWLPALFSFDIPYALSAVTETALQARGVERRFTLKMLNPQGDVIGIRPADRAPFESYLETLPPAGLDPSYPSQTFESERLLGAFLRWCAVRKIRVFGTLPVTFDDSPTPPPVEQKIAALYIRNAQSFLRTPSQSRYPRNCFYDTQYHLTEPCQIRHSKTLGRLLKSTLATPWRPHLLP